MVFFFFKFSFLRVFKFEFQMVFKFSFQMGSRFEFQMVIKFGFHIGVSNTDLSFKWFFQIWFSNGFHI